MVNFCDEAHFWRLKGIVIRNFNIDFIHSTSSSVPCLTISWGIPSYGVMTGPLKRPGVSNPASSIAPTYPEDELIVSEPEEEGECVHRLSPTGWRETPEIASECASSISRRIRRERWSDMIVVDAQCEIGLGTKLIIFWKWDRRHGKATVANFLEYSEINVYCMYAIFYAILLWTFWGLGYYRPRHLISVLQCRSGEKTLLTEIQVTSCIGRVSCRSQWHIPYFGLWLRPDVPR